MLRLYSRFEDRNTAFVEKKKKKQTRAVCFIVRQRLC